MFTVRFLIGAVFAGVGEDKCEKIQTSGLPEGYRNIGTYDF